MGRLAACAAVFVGFLGLAAGPVAAAPVNDNFANASPIALNATLTGSNVGATNESGEPTHVSGSSAASVWWTYTATTTGLLVVTTVGSLNTANNMLDTVLAVSTGTAVNNQVVVASNDDENFSVISTSKVIFQASAGTKYYFVVAGFAAGPSYEGSIRLHLNTIHTISVGAVPSAGGTATANGGTAPVRAEPQEYVTIQATATAPYGFVSWTEGTREITDAPGIQVRADADHTFAANFTDTTPTYTVALFKNGVGTVSGGGTFHGADLVTLVATPGPDYSFASWTENSAVVSELATYHFRASRARNLVANFVPYAMLNVSASPAGAGTATGGGLFPYRSTQVVDAVPTKPHWGFEAWVENGAVVGEYRPFPVTMDGTRNLVANFIGPEFRINTFTKKNQVYPALAVLNSGTPVAVWASDSQDGANYGIYGQRYTAKGKLLGKEFRINSTRKGDQTRPAIAALTGGGFVVVWTSDQDPAYGIYAQRFDANGVPVGGEFHVNTYKKRGQLLPMVAALKNGGFVIVWDSELQDKSDFGVYARIFTAAGAPAGGEFRVNPVTKDFQSEGRVAGLANGDFVIVWTSHSTASEYDVFGQRYSAAGAKIGAPFLVNNTKLNWQYGSSIAPLKDGGFIVSWTTYRQEGPGNIGVWARRFKANGKPAANEFVVALPTQQTDEDPVALGLPNGGYVIGWAGGHDFSSYGVYGQRFQANGLRVGRIFRINPTAQGQQSGLALSVRSDSSTFAAWHSEGQDGSGYAIYGVWKGP